MQPTRRLLMLLAVWLAAGVAAVFWEGWQTAWLAAPVILLTAVLLEALALLVTPSPRLKREIPAIWPLAVWQTAGLSPLTLPSVQPAYASKVVRGPQDSVWVIDEGDFNESSATLPRTKGRVYRSEVQSLTTVNLLQ